MNERVERLILDLWTQTRIDWGFATDRLAGAFRRDKRLGSHERREVSETLYGMIRQARRVDFALEQAGGRLGGGHGRDLARLVAYRLLEGEIGVDEAAARLRGPDWAAIAAVDERIARERDATRRFGLRHSLPDWLAARLLEEFGESAEALAKALNVRAPLTIRANTLKTDRDALAARLAADGLATRPTPYAPHGLVLETRVNVFGLAAYAEGLFEAQDEASQLVAELVAPPRGLVVDACAGAGGKTLALGALMESRGRLVALDLYERKLEELRRRARRAGLSNVRAVAIGPETWPAEVEGLAGRAERVLVDAPCSGIGALRRNPEARWRLTPEDLARLESQQLAIARRAARLVAPGGRLVYATCTILRAENEAQVERLLAAEPDAFEIVSPVEIWGRERAQPLVDATERFLRTLPHVHDTDGFFGAVLRRKR
jgi:16S rRNA (cytosine967-C5)-methyltransferase